MNGSGSGTLGITLITMYTLLLVFISTAGAITLNGSSEYATPGNRFDLICNVPEEATTVTFYKDPSQNVGSVVVSNATCYFRNDTTNTTTLCSENTCSCRPWNGTSLGTRFELVILPTAEDRNSSWSCSRYLPGSNNLTSEIYILPVAKGPVAPLSLSPSDISYTRTEDEALPTITCIADCTPTCSFVWTKPDNTNFTESPILSLGQLDRSETGIYTCTSRNIYGTVSISIIITVQYGPGSSISLNPPNVVYEKNEGDILQSITCSANCSPSCSFVWTKPDRSNFTVSPVLSLGELNRSEHGHYTCYARNDIGFASAMANVKVQYGPSNSVATSTSNIDKIENQTIPDITCTADCRPPCVFSWSRDRDRDPYSNPLSLLLAKREDSGNYTCTASNIVHQSTKGWSLTVRYNPRIVNLKYTQGNADIIENSSKSMTCAVESFPHSSITWYYKRNNTQLKTNSNVLESTYNLVSANCLDTGLYTCSASNSVSNTPTTMDLPINVLCKPRMDTRVTNIVKIGVSLSKDLIITASFMSNPEPTFSWLFHQNVATDVVHGKDRVSIRNSFNSTSLSAVSTLTRSRMEERWLGSYIVTVFNSQGSVTQVYTIVAQGKPDPPYQGKVECSDSYRAMLSWTSSFNGGSEQKFVVGMKGIQQDSFIINMNEKYDDPGRNETANAEISGLSPDRLYIFNVVAINEYGNSTLLEEVNCTTIRVPVSDVSINGGIIAAVVVSLLVIIALGAIAFFIFRGKIFALFNKGRDTELPSSGSRVNGCSDINADIETDTKTYDQVNFGTRENPPNEAAQDNTYVALTQDRDKPNLYDDLQRRKAPCAQAEYASVKRGDDANPKHERQSHLYMNVKIKNPKQDTDPTYINSHVLEMKKRKRKKKKS
ncbi:hemicentin-1-like [Pecten maximus]|uniref:hemicentin-1-like n=1 Tax=Pecten maximus TaxID=6579 RepID=UPI0014585E0D|nr:hemicentin-1-like [Pecten maximus]